MGPSRHRRAGWRRRVAPPTTSARSISTGCGRSSSAARQNDTTVQNLKTAIEQRLQRLLQQNPLRTDFQRHYEQIVAEYNREKDRVTIEKTFEALVADLGRRLDDEETPRHARRAR